MQQGVPICFPSVSLACTNDGLNNYMPFSKSNAPIQTVLLYNNKKSSINFFGREVDLKLEYSEEWGQNSKYPPIWFAATATCSFNLNILFK